MIGREFGVVLALCLVTACSPSGEADTQPAGESAASGVIMDAAAQVRMGVRVATIEAARAPRSVEGYARIMDVGPLAALEAEAAAAAAAATASQAEYGRLEALAAMDQAASVRAVEAARAQASADNARAALASRRIGLEWGAGLARLTPAQRSRLLNDVAAGRAALVRVDAPGEIDGASSVLLLPEETSAGVPATLLGPAGPAEARLQTAGVLALVRGPTAARLPAGRLIPARIALGGDVEGFLVPSAAVIRAGNATFVYVRASEDSFERRELTGARITDRGWFAESGFSAADVIVVEGAASVLAAELGPVEAE